MVLVYRAVLVPSALVSQVPTHRPLEKALATLTGDLAIVLPTALVRADDTYEISLRIAILQVGRVTVRGLGHVRGGNASGGGGDHARVGMC